MESPIQEHPTNQIDQRLREFVRNHCASADWLAVRYFHEVTRSRSVRNEVPEKNSCVDDEGAMIEVMLDGHIGYSATSDLSSQGLQRALDHALSTTRASSKHKASRFTFEVRPKAVGHHQSPRTLALDKTSTEEIMAILLESSRRLKCSELILARGASASTVETQIRYLSSNGSDFTQDFSMVMMHQFATAQLGSESQTRSAAPSIHQVGAEAFNRDRLLASAERVGREALELLHAENCPSDRRDLLAMPDQMDLQIHESIGHPLELDRILGDERNYAGWSFVKPEDFGTLRYGSELMNITFDPTQPGELASYAFDDAGAPASKQYLIKDGLLLRGLGGLESQSRLGVSGVANFRATSWNRAPIDRMANINLEPGHSSLEEMIAQVERGLLVETNRSWSIDDVRNKFQFGCERGRLIENGKLGKVVKNPNYRGTTVSFWNQLAAVGNRGLSQASGTPYCGKGEPNQVIRVGHASPPALFRDVEVFGGSA